MCVRFNSPAAGLRADPSPGLTGWLKGVGNGYGTDANTQIAYVACMIPLELVLKPVVDKASSGAVVPLDALLFFQGWQDRLGQDLRTQGG